MAQKGIALRKWSLSATDYDSEAEFREAVAQELASFEHIGERLGIGLVAAPIRSRLGDGDWFTAAWVFQTATVPGAAEAPPEDPLRELPEVDVPWQADEALADDPDRLAEVE